VSDLSTRPSTTKILGLTAVVDLVVGLVLAGVGLANDNQVLAVVGLALVLSGGGMLAFVVWSRNKPEAL
jgi:hypothetical protein